MFFRRQNGRYRETDRVTRYKLIKSGKHWLRASTSLFGLFKVLRGGVDTTQVMTEVVEDKVNPSITGLDIIKGLAATGAVLGGSVATQTKVFANETVAVEKTLENPDLLVTNDTAVLGTTSLSNSENSTSLSTSVSESASISESTSTSTLANTSTSVSTSMSVSASASTSYSASASASDSASMSTSLSQSTSQTSSVSTSVGASSEKTVSEIQDEKKVTTQNESKVDKIDSSILKPAAIESNAVKTNSDTTSLVGATAATLSSVETSVKKNEENRKKLTKLSAEMGEYLAKAAGLPNTDSAITKVNAAVTAIEKALANPTSDWTEVVQKATSARNSIVNAVLRAQSGARDARNGKVMKAGSEFRGFATQNSNLSSNVTSTEFDEKSRTAIWKIDINAWSALHNIGVKVEAGRGAHIQSATFNGVSMPISYQNGSEIVFNYRHGSSRNLNGTVLVTAKLDPNTNGQGTKIQVGTSSEPISQNTSGNYSQIHSVSVSSRNNVNNSRPNASNRPVITVDNDRLSVFNDDVIVDTITMSAPNKSARIAYWNKISDDPVPGVSLSGLGMNQSNLNAENVQGRISGVVGNGNASAQVGKTYRYLFGAISPDRLQQNQEITVTIRGFNERQNPISGDTVRAFDTSNLTADEIQEVKNKFEEKNRSLLEHSDYKKGSQTGSYTVDNTGRITVTYRDGTTDVVNASLDHRPFTERQNPVSGDKVRVFEPDNLTAEEIAAVKKNFESKNAGILNHPDFKKNSQTGSVEVSKSGQVTVTYLDQSTDVVTALTEKRPFAERQNPVSGDSVLVSDKSHLTPEERDEVKRNFLSKNSAIIKHTDYSKNNQSGNVTVSENGQITITYRDGSSDTVPANLTLDQVMPTYETVVTRNGQPIQPTRKGGKKLTIFMQVINLK